MKIFGGKSTFVFLVIFGSLLFLPFLGSVHLFDWDEINFAECAREMIVTENYLIPTINFSPFWEKPPLFIWMQVFSMKLFGINEFAARLPNAICGIATLLILFSIGKKIRNERFGLLWVLVYAGAFLPHFYFKSGIIDPWFNLFIFLGIYYFILHTYDQSHFPLLAKGTKNIFLSGLFIGLAVLTKGPVAFLIYFICISIYWIYTNLRKILSFQQFLLGSTPIFFVGGIWFFLEILENKSGIIEFINYQVKLLTTQESGHGGPFYFHALVLLFGCFPASVFAIQAFRNNKYDNLFQSHFKIFMVILFWVVLILFSIVKTKIVHYSSLAWFPLTYLSAYTIQKITSKELKWRNSVAWLTGIVGLLMGFLFFAIPLFAHYKHTIISANLIKDEFAVENIKASVDWTGYEILPGLIYMAGVAVFLIMMKAGQYKRAFIGLLFLSIITINTISILIVPKIEKYTQRAAIEFYKNLQTIDCYVQTLGFMSYAHLFYSDLRPPSNINYANQKWLLNGNIDKPAFFVTRIYDAKEYQTNYPELIELYRKNGFVFYKRHRKGQ